MAGSFNGHCLIKNVVMSKEMERFALDTFRTATSQFSMSKEMATAMKRAFDRKYGRNWHCIVGRDYGR
ncbi:unnamed protein product [Echinostoma caproni]|uniref:Dynein light chain n=1 Tax=Echinostoma caproni TaxID=27848 RepID=A0A183B5S8_9TREM|nr:unnamed protein product [Echinostoma caproni]